MRSGRAKGTGRCIFALRMTSTARFSFVRPLVVVGLLLALGVYWSRFRTVTPGARRAAPQNVASSVGTPRPTM